MNECSCQYSFFELADGRVWNVKDARFADVCTAMENARTCLVLDERHLVKTLREEGVPVVEPTGDADRDDAMALRELRLHELQRKQEELDAYRLALLDVPDRPGFPDRVEWPVRPW